MGGGVRWERWCKMYHSSACTRRGEITGITCATTAIIKRFKRFHAVYVSPARTCNVPNYVGRPKKKMYNRSTKFCTALRRVVQWLQRGLSEEKKKPYHLALRSSYRFVNMATHVFCVGQAEGEGEKREKKRATADSPPLSKPSRCVGQAVTLQPPLIWGAYPGRANAATW